MAHVRLICAKRCTVMCGRVAAPSLDSERWGRHVSRRTASYQCRGTRSDYSCSDAQVKVRLIAAKSSWPIEGISYDPST